MRTQVRIIALVTATVAVLGALLVLFIRVRSEQEVVVPEDALSMARARYEQAQAGVRGRRASEPTASFQADSSATATRPPQRPAMDEPAAERPGPPGTSGVRAAPPSPAPASTSDTETELNAVRTAYDQGDFEQALDLAEKFLRRNGMDDYIKRVAVVSACAMGEEAVAQRHYNEMTSRDQPVVAKRCKRYGIQF